MQVIVRPPSASLAVPTGRPSRRPVHARSDGAGEPAGWCAARRTPTVVGFPRGFGGAAKLPGRKASTWTTTTPKMRNVRARAENDGRGKNPNEMEGPVTFGGEMVGVGIFLLIAFQFFVLAFL